MLLPKFAIDYLFLVYYVSFHIFREGLQLSSQPKEFRIQERSPLTLSWHQLGAYTGGQFTWVRSQDYWNVNNHCSKGWCTCVNGLWENKWGIYRFWLITNCRLCHLWSTKWYCVYFFLSFKKKGPEEKIRKDSMIDDSFDSSTF